MKLQTNEYITRTIREILTESCHHLFYLYEDEKTIIFFGTAAFTIHRKLIYSSNNRFFFIHFTQYGLCCVDAEDLFIAA